MKPHQATLTRVITVAADGSTGRKFCYNPHILHLLSTQSSYYDMYRHQCSTLLHLESATVLTLPHAHLVLVHSCLASFVSIWKSIRAREISNRCSSDLQQVHDTCRHFTQQHLGAHRPFVHLYITVGTHTTMDLQMLTSTAQALPRGCDTAV